MTASPRISSPRISTVVSDVDGTLVTDDKMLTVRAQAAVAKLHACVIGDGANDVSMFLRSGLSIAMGNASPAVKRAADFITDSNRDDRFANAVEQFIFGNDRSNAQVTIVRPAGRA